MNTFIDVTVEDLMELNSTAAKYAKLRATEQLSVDAVMSTDIITVRPEQTLAEAAHLLVEHRISGLPVVDGDNKLAGIVTEADFLRSIGVPSHHPAQTFWQSLESLFNHHHHQVLLEPAGKVAELMESNVISVRQGATLHEAIERMKRHKIKRVIVCDHNRYVKGIITRSNLVRLFFDKLKD
jgi:CBS-domain-containing membrane protein